MSEERWYRHIIRVRYQETDQMGVVYHTNYLNWFEWGRTELIRTMGMSYGEMESRGLLLPVTHAELAFKQPARYDDTIAIYTRISEFSGLKLHFANEVRRLAPGGDPNTLQSSYVPIGTLSDGGPYAEPEGELLVSGGTRHVWVNRSWKPARIDKAAPELYKLLQELA